MSEIGDNFPVVSFNKSKRKEYFPNTVHILC